MAKPEPSRLERAQAEPMPGEPRTDRPHARLLADAAAEPTPRTRPALSTELEPAPGRLALGIMARLAQTAEEQPRPQPASAALGLALALAALVLLPLLGALGWAILSSIGSPAAFSLLAQRALDTLAALWNSLHALAGDARALAAAYPELPIAAALLPLGAWALLRVLNVKTPAAETRPTDGAARGRDEGGKRDTDESDNTDTARALSRLSRRRLEGRDA
jgi:hypothetical protein